MVLGAGGRAAADYGNVCDSAACAAMVRRAVESFGSIDIVVNNAGNNRRNVFADTTLDDLEFAWGDSFVETEPYGRAKKVARYYVARTKTEAIKLPVSPELGRPEHHEWRWCDFETAGQLVNMKWSTTVLSARSLPVSSAPL